MDAFAVWKKARLKMSTVLIGHINVNSIRNKFHMLTSMIKALTFSWFRKRNLILLLPMLNLSLKDMPLHLDMIEIVMVSWWWKIYPQKC